MEFRKVLALRGPNIWTNSPVLEAWVDLGDAGSPLHRFSRLQRPADDVAAHDDRAPLQHRRARRLLSAFAAGDLSRPYPRARDPGTAVAGRGWTSVSAGPAKPRSRAFIAWSSSTSKRRWARQCLAVGRELVLAAIHDRPFDLKGELHKLRDLADEVLLGAEHGAIVDAARLPRHPGAAAEHRQPGAVGPRLAAAAHPGGRDRSHRRHRRGDRAGQGTDADVAGRRRRAGARRAVRWPTPKTPGRPPTSIGVPVVVKPRDGNQGRGVATNLTTREQVTGRLPGRAGRERQQAGDRGEIRRGPRLPPAGRGRQGRGRRPPRAGPGPGRRRRTPSGNWSTWSTSIRAAASITPPC